MGICDETRSSAIVITKVVENNGSQHKQDDEGGGRTRCQDTSLGRRGDMEKFRVSYSLLSRLN